VNRWTLLALAGTGILAAVARAPFLTAGVTPDEGGYAYIAREWARGRQLYQDLWIDRPQGLLSVYRFAIGIADQPLSIRMTALLIGVLVTLLVGAIGWMLRSPATGVAAAAIYAVVGAGPHIEGFALNGELVAALPATGAVAAAVAWWRTDRRGWLFAAGVLGGGAILMKQGGFDGLAAALALAVAVPGPALARARAAAIVAAGAAVPIAASLLHGLAVGFGRYWTDVVAFPTSDQFASRNGSRTRLFEARFPAAKQDLLALAAVALVGLAVVALRRTERVVVVAWLLAAFVAFNLGGLYWPHYYVQLVAPLAVLAGIGATGLPLRFRPLAVALACLAMAPVVVSLIDVQTKPTEARELATPYAAGFERIKMLASFVRRNTTPGDTFYVLDSRADLYYLADRRAAYPYLWHNGPLLTKAGMALLRRTLDGPSRPKLVALLRNPKHVDRTGALARILRRRYRFIGRVPPGGGRVLVDRGAGGGQPRAQPLR
jgi:4-amino-4-deoxy-L-arabinose transferase-like glycosyltransferase